MTFNFHPLRQKNSHNFSVLFKSTRGAILVEVLISIIIFTLGVTGTLALLIQSVNANSVSRNRTIAINLAREGIEVVRNMRDTNWLLHSAHLRECWNYWADTNQDGNLSGDDPCIPNESGQNNHPIGKMNEGRVQFYIVDFHPETLRWVLIPATQRPDDWEHPTTFLNYTNGEQNGEVETYDILENSNAFRTPQLYINEQGRYTHRSEDGDGNQYQAAPFYRILEVTYVDSDDGLFPNGQVLAEGEGKYKDNRLKVEAHMYWKDTPRDENFKSLSLEISTLLTDYFHRTNWSD